jgi:HK97 family phage prohead protease
MTTTRETRIVPFSTKSLPDEDAGSFEGYGSVFGVLDTYDDVVEPGAFASAVRSFGESQRRPAMLWQHDPRIPVGVWTELREDATGLYVKGRLSNTQAGRDSYTLLKDGALDGLSIGFSIEPNGSMVDDDGVRHLTALRLWEVSLVTFPANDPARISAVKSDGTLPTEREFERWLQREAGFTALQAAIIIAKGYRQVKRGGAVPPGDDVTALLESVRRFKPGA